MSMRYEKLKSTISLPYFTISQIYKYFPDENITTLTKQLSRLVENKQLIRIKRGLYVFSDRDIDDLELAYLIYQPSYISLETALNIYGLIPDIPAQTTSITTITPNTFQTIRGSFSYSSVERKLFFGFGVIENKKNNCIYQIAEPEKALLDWIYIRKLKDLTDSRLDANSLDMVKINRYGKYFPSWVIKTLDI